ncbi:MAG: GTPase Era [Bacteroidota bacterium]
MMRSGFVNFFGKPNAGKSTLLNFLMEEKLAIVSSKVQTTRHRIKGILTEDEYQIVLSDTPGIIDPKYPLHHRMMEAVRSALEDGDLSLLLVDANSDWDESDKIFAQLKLKGTAWVLLTKTDLVDGKKKQEAIRFFQGKPYANRVLTISTKRAPDRKMLIVEMVKMLPVSPAFFPADEISDAQTRFFASELIREKIFELTSEEIPYHATVMVREFQEKTTLVKIVADIVVHRESQKAILIGEKGSMIKRLGTEARQSIESFLQRKVFLELFVKVRPKWRESDIYLDEYGY